MSLLGNIWVKLGLKSNDFESGMTKAEKRAERFGSFLGKMSAKMVLGWAAVAAAIAKFSKASVANYQQQQQANIKLQNALKNTGAAIGYNYDELRSYADQLQKVNGFADDATMSAMATLTTFRSVQGKVFKDTIAAAQDMAKFLGTDLNTTVQQLGKALEAPEVGITMLRRSGVVFTKEMTDGIKQMVKEGKLYEAQLLILEEVNKRFGGEAARQADTAAGQWKRVGMAFGDLTEKIGQSTEASKKLATSLASALEMADKIVSSEALTRWEKFKVLVLGLGQDKAVKKMLDLDQATGEMTKHAKEYAEQAVKGLNTIEDAEKRLAKEQRGLSKATSDQRKADHTAAIELIKARIQALNEEEAKREEEAETARKEAAEKAKQLKEWREQHTGILNELNDEIAAKEKLLRMAQDTSEVAQLNAEIERLKEKKRILEEIGKNQGLDYSGITGKIPGSAGGLKVIPDVIDTTPLKNTQDKIDDFLNNYEKQTKQAEMISESFSNALRQGAIAGLNELAEAIGSGDWDTSTMVKALLSPIADAAISLGTIVMTSGEAMKALNDALVTMGENPYAAMVIGAALVGVGTMAKAGIAAIAKNSSGSASSGNPYTYTGGYGVTPVTMRQGAGTMEITGTITVKGQDLQIALDNYNRNKGR